MDMNKRRGIAVSILIAEAVGMLSGFFAGPSRAIYKELELPSLAPPGWLFPIVWTILYACMGVAAYLIYADRHVRPDDKQRALGLYALQLFVNFWWSIFFFRWGMLFTSVVVILILDVLVVLTMDAFSKIQPIAATILFPYLVWILFATYLNFSIWSLN